MKVMRKLINLLKLLQIYNQMKQMEKFKIKKRAMTTK